MPRPYRETSLCPYMAIWPRRKAGYILILAFSLWMTLQMIPSLEVMEESIIFGIHVQNKSIIATSPSRMDEYVNCIARPFMPFEGPEWCQIDNQQSMTLGNHVHNNERYSRPDLPLEGLMLTKVHKAGSTTAAGVTLSIAHRVAQRRLLQMTNQTIPSRTIPATLSHSNGMCNSHFYHTFAMDNFHSNRKLDKSFLWTTVRLPHVRAESAFYYYHPERFENVDDHLKFLSLSRGFQLQLIRKRRRQRQDEVSEAINMKNESSSLSEVGGNLYLRGQYPAQARPSASMMETDLERLAFDYVRKEVLEYYNFVAVTERWAESMAVLKFLLPGVQYSDLIVLRTKERGSFVRHGLDSCAYIPYVSKVPDPIQTYLDGPYRDTNPDYLLYAAVNQSLDLTIERIGRGRVEHGVRQIQSLQHIAQETCMDASVLPCTDSGDVQEGSCYVRDFGCGYKCIGGILPLNNDDADE